ncbi:MAG: GntR family transcriptional regulator [Actinoplanes sp.]
MVGRQLLRDAAYERMRDAIVDGTLAPGSALRPDDVAHRLGLSRAPVREAIARLAADGLVETKPQSYTRVTEVVEKDVQDAAAVIAALHDLAVRGAAGRLTETDLSRMLQANARFAEAVRTGALDAALDADDDLHAVPVAVHGNAAAAATLERYAPLIRRAERLLFSSPQAERSVRLHAELIDALAAGDAARAVATNQAIWGHLHHSVDAP